MFNITILYFEFGAPISPDVVEFDPACISALSYIKNQDDYLMKLVERMPRVCKAVIKAKGGNFEESQK